MKLIYCKECHDIVQIRVSKDENNNIISIPRHCTCRKSFGYFTDRISATIVGPCIPIGISGYSFKKALQERKQSDEPDWGGTQFNAFVIPVECATVTHIESEK